VAPRACGTDACLRRTLALLLLLGVLAISRDMPTASASGIELLPMKLRWSLAWAGLHTTESPLTPLAAHLTLAMDSGLHTALGREAAGFLARNGAVRDRLRWSAALARTDRRSLPLLVRAVDAALETTDCELLDAAVQAAQSVPRGDRARVAREFGRSRFAHWGATALRSGLRISNQPELRLALHRAQRRPTTRGRVAPCPM
jgi:hypothetical protein